MFDRKQYYLERCQIEKERNEQQRLMPVLELLTLVGYPELRQMDKMEAIK